MYIWYKMQRKIIYAQLHIYIPCFLIFFSIALCANDLGISWITRVRPSLQHERKATIKELWLNYSPKATSGRFVYHFHRSSVRPFADMALKTPLKSWKFKILPLQISSTYDVVGAARNDMGRRSFDFGCWSASIERSACVSISTSWEVVVCSNALSSSYSSFV